MQGIHEACGLFGIYSARKSDLASDCYYGLYALQHRGQASCGIAVNDEGLIQCIKSEGLVNEVFQAERLRQLQQGRMAMGHVRYGTKTLRDSVYGSDPQMNAQPLVIDHIKGALALAHNGAVSNAAQLRQEQELIGSIFHTTADSEVIAYEITRARLHTDSIEEAIAASMERIEGAYSLLVMSSTKLIALRDPHGLRPLCIGRRGEDWIFASESCALDSVGAEFVRDVEPGEIVIVDKDGLRSDKRHVGKVSKATCVFEYIYFARPDSVIDGSSVHIARQRAGSLLALEHPVQADVVVGVPDSGIDAAIGYARQSGIPYGLGFIKNKYIGRTFIQPEQSQREDLVRIKLNPISSVVKGKRVVLVDDSIVRGTTCTRIISLLRSAGATEVHLRSSAPKFLYPCFYGTDVDSQEHLIACHLTDEEMCRKFGADSLGFLSVENVRRIADNSTGFCTACFDGEYVTKVPETHFMSKYRAKIKEEKV